MVPQPPWPAETPPAPTPPRLTVRCRGARTRPNSWLERPRTATPEVQAELDRLTVTAQVPVYNEDPDALRGDFFRCCRRLPGSVGDAQHQTQARS
ncbi:hypothetical protein ACH4A8_19975 [Streptomyces vietnamensis]|uniref:hypothetical protein n=1 Tax=Streptomyces vietnamensis TaxID=362257 RepID=UPI0037B5FF7C